MSVSDRIAKLIRSPKGQQLIERGRREIAKPENQARIRRLLEKNRKR